MIVIFIFILCTLHVSTAKFGSFYIFHHRLDIQIAYSIAIRCVSGGIREKGLLIDEELGPRNFNIDLVLIFKLHIALQLHVDRQYSDVIDQSGGTLY